MSLLTPTLLATARAAVVALLAVDVADACPGAQAVQLLEAAAVE